MPSPPRHPAVQFVCAVLAAALVAGGGCGTTRWSDSKRTATEQLLIADAVERAVMQIDMRPLAGQTVFLETTVLNDVADGNYMASALKHQLLASGCRLAASQDSADIVVEARAGALGTDRNELLFGIPATSVQVAGNGTSIPEMALFKRTDQRGVAEINLFAYERASGRAVWQSGLARIDSNTRDRWMMGTGPFQDGDIHDRIEFAGERVRSPWRRKGDLEHALPLTARTDLRTEKVFASLPPPGSPAADRPVVADERPAELPPVR
ncbi:MAG: DUF6655 family protein [Planctomycetota bacterium]